MNKKSVILVGFFSAILLSTFFYALGHNTKVNELSVKQVSENNKKYQDTKKKISELKDTINECFWYKQNKAKLDSDITTNKQTIESLIKEASSLDAQIKGKQDELNKLNGQVIAAKGNPITLPAGKYTVGGDIPEGRYRISGSSNFVVRTTEGRIVVNAILGDSSVGDGDYVCTLVSGNLVDASSQTTYTPIN